MVSPNQPNLHEIDWSKMPAPEDDGRARHPMGLAVPDVALAATVIDDGRISGVLYPVFPPDRNAGDVLAWLERNRRP